MTDNELPPADRKRMRPEDRRNAVLDAALRVFAEAGFRRASLAEVGEEAGVTKGCVYHYFESKEQLLLALMRERSCSAAAACRAMGEAGTRDERLALMVRSLWRRYDREGELDLTTVALAELPHAPEVARVFFEEVVSRNRAYLRDTLVHDGPSDTGAVDPDLVAMLLPYMVMGAALGARLYRDIDPVERTPDEIEAALLSILTRGV